MEGEIFEEISFRYSYINEICNRKISTKEFVISCIKYMIFMSRGENICIEFLRNEMSLSRILSCYNISIKEWHWNY